MTLSCFILLSEEQKKWTVLHKGVLIAKRSDQQHKVFLFQLGNYYVETLCNQESKVIEEYRVFDSTIPLQPYLQSISLDNC